MNEDLYTWPEPTSLSPEIERPSFPLEALPLWVANKVVGTATFTQTPVDLPGTLALSVLSTAAGGRTVVEARPGWREPTNLFTAVALKPGNRKSQVFESMCQSLFDAEQAQVAAILPDIVEKRSAKAVAEAKALRKQAEAARKDNAETEEEARAAAAMAEAITVPTQPRLLADDATPEALASLMATHGGRMSVLSAEGGVFDLMGGRYSRSRPNLDVYLKGHAGDSMRVDRQDRNTQFIRHAYLTIGVTVQPGVLLNAGQVAAFQVRGLLARFLYSVPRSYVGHRRSNPPLVDAEVTETYERNMRALVASLAEWTDPAVLMFDSDAQSVLINYQDRLEPRLAEDAELGAPLVVEWASKLVGAVARIAGLIHVAEHIDTGWKEPVTGRTVRAASLLGDYFLAHARWVFGDLIGGSDTIINARAVLEWIAKLGEPVEISRRDIHQGNRARFPSADAVDPVLVLLEDYGWLRRKEQQRVGPGRPSERYEVTPWLWTHSQNTHKPQYPGIEVSEVIERESHPLRDIELSADSPPDEPTWPF